MSKKGKHIHVDMNAAYNLVRKEYQDAFMRRVIPVKLYPRRINVAINDNLEISPISSDGMWQVANITQNQSLIQFQVDLYF